jgi:hypothetical protein
MYLNQITENFPGRKNVIHPIMQLCPSVTYVRPMKTGRPPIFLKNTYRDLICQGIQVDTPRVTVPINIFNQNLWNRQISFIPTHSTAKGIHLNPIRSYLFTLLLYLA